MKKYRFELLLAICYLLLAVILTWPLAANFGSSIYGLWGDHFGQLWSDWWRKEALFSGKPLEWTPLLDAPFGFKYPLFGMELLHLLSRFGLSLLLNEVLSFNIWFLLSFPLSGLAVYFLVKNLTKNKLASAFSGLIYAFSMYRFSHAWEHSSLVFTWWTPLYVLGLVKFSERRNVKNAIVAALLFTAVLLDNFYYGYFTIIFTVFFFLFQVKRWLSWRSLKLLFLFSVLCFLFSVPFILPTVEAALTGNAGGELETTAYQRSPDDLRWQSARPWFYVLPSPRHPVFGKFSRKVLDWIATKPPYFLTQDYDGNEHNLYLTWTGILLSVIAVFAVRRSKKFENWDLPISKKLRAKRQFENYTKQFLLLGAVMAIFSAPPMATLAGFRIYFPSHYLYNFFPMFRAYARFGVLVLLCVSVLAGFGLKFVLEKIKSFYRRLFVLLFFCSFVLLEVLLPPMNVNLTPPEAYLWLKNQPGDFIVMEYPLPTNHSDLLYQRVHGKRLFDPRRDQTSKFLKTLSKKRDINPHLLSESIVEFPNILKEIGVKYVILHKDQEDPLKRLEDFVDWSGYRPAAEFSDIIIYEVVGK